MPLNEQLAAFSATDSEANPNQFTDAVMAREMPAEDGPYAVIRVKYNDDL